jgi:hypothetical protein
MVFSFLPRRILIRNIRAASLCYYSTSFHAAGWTFGGIVVSWMRRCLCSENVGGRLWHARCQRKEDREINRIFGVRIENPRRLARVRRPQCQTSR